MRFTTNLNRGRGVPPLSPPPFLTLLHDRNEFYLTSSFKSSTHPLTPSPLKRGRTRTQMICQTLSAADEDNAAASRLFEESADATSFLASKVASDLLTFARAFIE